MNGQSKEGGSDLYFGERDGGSCFSPDAGRSRGCPTTSWATHLQMPFFLDQGESITYFSRVQKQNFRARRGLTDVVVWDNPDGFQLCSSPGVYVQYGSPTIYVSEDGGQSWPRERQE